MPRAAAPNAQKRALCLLIYARARSPAWPDGITAALNCAVNCWAKQRISINWIPRSTRLSATVFCPTPAVPSAQLRESELARARAVWQKKYGSAPKTPAERARQMRFLAMRGFEADTLHPLFKNNL